MRLVHAVCICLLLFLHVCASDNHAASSLPPFDPNVLSSKWYSEVYTLTGLLDDQTFVQTQMMVTNIGLGDSNAACEMLVLHFGEKPVKTSRRFKKTFWRYADEPNPTLSIGSCCLTQVGETTRCVISLDGISAAISLGRPAGLPKSPDTILTRDASKKFLTYEVLIPWARLRTTLRLPGRPEKELQGFGLVEHTRSVGFPKDFSRGWISFYGGREGGQFLAIFHFPACKSSGAVGWSWDSREGSPKAMVGLQTVMKTTGTFSILPTVTALHDPSFIIEGQQSLCRFSLIDEIGPLLGNIVRLIVGNPVTRFYLAQARVSAEQSPIEGVLEIMNLE
jgi:hypothetical protein